MEPRQISTEIDLAGLATNGFMVRIRLRVGVRVKVRIRIRVMMATMARA